MTFKEFCTTLTEFLNDNPAIMWLLLIFIILDYSIVVYRTIKKVPCSKNTMVYLHCFDGGAVSKCKVVYYRKKKQFIVIPDVFYDDFLREADSIEEGPNGRKSNTDTGTCS